MEGLGYDPTTQSLLLALKGKAKIKSDQELKKSKAVYTFSIATEICSEEPFLVISDDALEDFVNKAYVNRNNDVHKSRLKRAKSFAPSAVAKHPTEDNYYLLSSVGRLMLVVNNKSEIISLDFLDGDIHVQPEGICFGDDGDLYISNEGRFGIARIFRFNVM